MPLPYRFALCVTCPPVREAWPAPVAVLVVVLVLRGVEPWWALTVAASVLLLRTPSR